MKSPLPKPVAATGVCDTAVQTAESIERVSKRHGAESEEKAAPPAG